MKTRINGLLLGMMGSFVFCAPSFAQDTGKTHNFRIGAEVSSYEYKEPGLMKLSGMMYGFSTEYLNNGGVGRIKGSVPIQLRGRLNYMRGDDITYDGSYHSGGSLKNTGKSGYFFDTAFLGGAELKLGGNFSAAPYMGLAYRYLIDNDDGGPGDYKRKQTYIYLPIGADWKKPLPSGWSLAINTELDVLLRGDNTSYVKHYYGTNLKFKQDSGWGLRLSVKTEKDFKAVGVFVEPFYRYWDIAKSNSVRYTYGGLLHEAWEPKNRTNEYGLKFGVTF